MVKKYLTRENLLITDNYMFQICFLSASLGLTDDQREFQRVALEFAKNELAPEMQKWDQEVCEKKGFNFFLEKLFSFTIIMVDYQIYFQFLT